MSQFPLKQSEVAALAESVLAGLTGNPAIFPAPTVDLAEFRDHIELYRQAAAELTEVRGRMELAAKAKMQAFNALKLSLKKQLRYAENTTGFDDTRLNTLGWSGKRQRISRVPGQVRNLKVLEQGSDFVVLSWLAPIDGGKAAAYQVARRDGDGKWIDAGVSLTTRVKLLEQPRHTDMEYRIAAINKTGQGALSNTIAVVL